MFHRAIAQSGCALNGFARGVRDTSKQLALALDMPNSSEKEILERLITLPIDRLYEVSEEVTSVSF